MKKKKQIYLTIFLIIFLIAIFSAIYLTKVNKYKNKSISDLPEYKNINSSDYAMFLNGYYDYDFDTLYSMYIVTGQEYDGIYEQLGNITIRERIGEFDYTADTFSVYFSSFTNKEPIIEYMFCDDSIIIDGYRYRVIGLDELKAYIDSYTITLDEVIKLAGEDTEAIDEQIKAAFSSGQISELSELIEDEAYGLSDSVYIRYMNYQYNFSTTGSGLVINYYPIDENFYIEDMTMTGNGISLFSTNNNVEPISILNNQEAVRQFIEDNSK